MVNTEVLGKAFEPEQPFENADGTPIQFDEDYFGIHRGAEPVPGPFASAKDAEKMLFTFEGVTIISAEFFGKVQI